MDQLGIILKASRPAAFASLVRIVGDFDLAEEAIQEALYRAVIDWKKKRIPDNPIGWLVQTGRRFVIDVHRRKQIEHRHRELVSKDSENDLASVNHIEINELQLHDDQLRLIFTCCHPALSVSAQVALSLKTVAGLSLPEIARAYLIPVKTLEQRIIRAKRKIREAAIPYEIPSDDQIVPRLESVMRTIYLIYTQAYTNLKGADLLDSQLSEAAIYLAYMLNRLIRGNSEAQGLLALMILQHARANARVDVSGLPVPLEEQNRKKWDQHLIAEGLMLVDKFSRHKQLGHYQIQAAISAEHCKALTPEDTQWQKILSLYEQLEESAPNPVVTLNRAIAVARLHGPEHGLEILASIAKHPQLENFQYYHSTLANLLHEAGDTAAAIVAFKKAFDLSENGAEKRYLQMKIDDLI